MVIFQGKRGAIELSMNTIIIVVIGITILTLGLRWIYGIFGGLEEQQQQLERLSEEQIVALFGGSQDAINLPTSIVKVPQGKRYNLQVIIRNILGNTQKFRYGLNVDSIPSNIQENIVMGKISWHKSEMNLPSGEGFQDYVSFDTSKLPLGIYRFRLVLDCLDCTPADSRSAPVILEVTAK
jgi:hypothetical protein